MQHLILLLPIFLFFISNIDKKNSLIICIVLLYLFSVLRYEFGNDYTSYYNNFILTKNGEGVFLDEPLIHWLMLLSPNYYLFIAITSLFFLIMVYYLIVKYADISVYSGVLFVFLISPYIFLMSLSAIRQTVATCFFIIAVQYAKKKKILMYIIFTFLASLCHNSAIVLLPIYFIANEKTFSRRQTYIWAGVVILLLILPQSYLNNGINRVLNLFENNYDDYMVEDALTNSVRATLLTSITLIYLLIVLPYLKKGTLLCAKLYLIAVTFGVLAYKLSMLTRIQMYFDIFGIIALPMAFKEIYEKLRNNSSKGTLQVLCYYGIGILLPIFIILIFCLRYYSFFTNPLWAPFFHYKTILELIL